MAGKAQLLLAVSAVALLQGCADGQNPFKSDKPVAADTAEAAAPEVTSATRIVERDVESPETFQATEQGLWDGRPSLGGVWVAYSDVKDPERVIIRNQANGKFVIGALFRRERANPGPALQVSSDAAAALGMLAGAPEKLSVVALKREEVPVAPQDVAPMIPKGAIATEEVDTKPLDPVVAGAAAAIDKADPKADPKADAAAPQTAAIAADAGATPAPEAAERAAAEPQLKKKKGLFSFLRRNKQPNPAPETTVLASAPAQADAAPTAPVIGAGDAPEIASAAAPAPKPPQLKSPLDKGFIQIGIFSVETNANNTATAMRRDGMVPTIKKSTMQGKDYWRVLVGPAVSTGERSQLLRKVKDLGFTDAYLVSG